VSSRGWEEDYLNETSCLFPKHRDEAWYNVIQNDRPYVRWLLENVEDMDDDLRDALEWGVDHVPDRI
jgi:hypothetical protein